MNESSMERHYINRIGWLRAAVLGANDGVLSTASIIVGVASASSSRQQVFVAGVAALIAGAMSMAAGEYVSVSSQADTEKADLRKEAEEIAAHPRSEQRELAAIYARRGLEPALARQVAEQLTAHDPLAAHARDELGISKVSEARPVQAALASAASFASGALLPLLAATLSPSTWTLPAVAAASLAGLVILGTMGARAGGAPAVRAVTRVVFWGAAAMAVTAIAGHLFGGRGG